ncbi:hypothetical protein HDV05_008740, partial [Chytridiales sp. JEL 0842]
SYEDLMKELNHAKEKARRMEDEKEEAERKARRMEDEKKEAEERATKAERLLRMNSMISKSYVNVFDDFSNAATKVYTARDFGLVDLPAELITDMWAMAKALIRSHNQEGLNPGCREGSVQSFFNSLFPDLIKCIDCPITYLPQPSLFAPRNIPGGSLVQQGVASADWLDVVVPIEFKPPTETLNEGAGQAIAYGSISLTKATDGGLDVHLLRA